MLSLLVCSMHKLNYQVVSKLSDPLYPLTDIKEIRNFLIVGLDPFVEH